MNKNIYIITQLLLLSLTVTSQNVKPRYAKFANTTVLDTSKIECIYEYSITDPILKKTIRNRNILQIGDICSRYWGYNIYRRDSAVYSMPDISKITTTEALAIFNKYKSSSIEQVHKNRKDNSVYVVDRIPFSTYRYEEILPDWNWTLTEDTLTVCGHLCSKATTTFRGRDWTAWYSEAIAEDVGPWKFSGLPGLILKVEDRDKEHIFDAILLRKSNSQIVRYDNKSYIITTREKFIKEKNIYKDNPKKYAVGTGMMQTDDVDIEEKPRKLFYNQIERE